jgi:hypothetical protein
MIQKPGEGEKVWERISKTSLHRVKNKLFPKRKIYKIFIDKSKKPGDTILLKTIENVCSQGVETVKIMRRYGYRGNITAAEVWGVNACWQKAAEGLIMGAVIIDMRKNAKRD